MPTSTIKVVNQDADTTQTMHRHGDEGRVLHGHELRHGPAHSTQAVVASVTGDVLTLNGIPTPLTVGALQHGWTLQLADGSATTCIVQSVTLGTDGHSIASVTVDNAAGISNGSTLVWDPIDEGSYGHTDSGYYNPAVTGKLNDPKAGWVKTIQPAEAAAKLHVYPDGTIVADDGSGDTTTVSQPDGLTVGLGNLAVGGAQLAAKLMGQGTILFDAGEYDSGTQEAIPYNNGTAGTTITPNTANFYGGAPSAIQASWVAETADAKTGMGDAILQLTTKNTGSWIRWFDTVIIDGSDGHTRTCPVSHDISFEFPIYVSSTGSTALALGASCKLRQAANAGDTVLYPNYTPTKLQAAAGQTWILEPGTSVQETVTLGTPNTTTETLPITSALVYAHAFNAPMVMRTTASGTVLPSGGTLDTHPDLGSLPSAVDAILVGFMDADGTWHRAWWGDPAAIPPWDSSAKWLGKLTSVTGSWTKLICKASDLRVYVPGGKKKTLEGVELAVYSANGGQTVYFDAHSAAAKGGQDTQPDGGLGGNKMPPQSHKQRHKLPAHHADAHVHSDLTYWVDSANVVHWESGTLVTHDGHTFTINGGTEDDPNTGITGHAGDYLVFNTSSGSSIQVSDPTYGTVTIPAYSASGGSGGQTAGFAVLSEAFNWSGRPGGGTVKRGPVDNLTKVGKLSHNADEYTGTLNHYSHGKHSKLGGRKHQKGSIGRAHQYKHNTNRHKHKGFQYSFTKATSASSPYTWQDTLSWGSGNITDESGTSLGAINAGSMTVHNDDIIVADTSTSPVTIKRYDGYGTGSANAKLDRHDTKTQYALGEISSSPDSHTHQLYFFAWGHGHHQSHGAHHAKASVGRAHGHHTVPHRGHFVNARFRMSGLTFGVAALGGNDVYTTPYYQSDAPLPKTGGTKVPLCGTLSVGDDQVSAQLFQPSISFPAGGSMGAETMVFFDPDTGSNGAWYAAPQGTDTTTQGKYSPDFTQMVKVGHVSSSPDKDGDYIFHSYFAGSHTNHHNHQKENSIVEKHVGVQQLHGGEVTGSTTHKDHHNAKSHSKRHDMDHKAHKHVHHSTTFECVGTTLYVNYSDGGLTNNGQSTLVVDDGTTYWIDSAVIGVAENQVIYADITTPGNCPVYSSGYNAGIDTHLYLCQIGPADADGNLTTLGWHHGPHKVHEKHLKQKAVKTKHIAPSATNQQMLYTNASGQTTWAPMFYHGDYGSFSTDSSGNFTASVSFPFTFPNTPGVFLQIGGDWLNGSNQGMAIYPNSISTTGFTLNVRNAVPSTNFSHLYYLAMVNMSGY